MYGHTFITNTATGRVHPCFFTPAPLPGGTTSPLRWRSRAHHTEGFDTLDAAQANVDDFYRAKEQDNPVFLGNQEWDGDGTPTGHAFIEGWPE